MVKVEILIEMEPQPHPTDNPNLEQQEVTRVIEWVPSYLVRKPLPPKEDAIEEEQSGESSSVSDEEGVTWV